MYGEINPNFSLFFIIHLYSNKSKLANQLQWKCQIRWSTFRSCGLHKRNQMFFFRWKSFV